MLRVIKGLCFCIDLVSYCLNAFSHIFVMNCNLVVTMTTWLPLRYSETLPGMSDWDYIGPDCQQMRQNCDY